MKLIADLHTHTSASQHVYSTLYENVIQAARGGLKVLACTDHGPALPDSPHVWRIAKQKKYPRLIEGVRVLKGVEANITSFGGELDIPEETLDNLEWVIASLHHYVISPAGFQDHTACWMRVAENPRVDLIGHCAAPRFPFDMEPVVKAFRKGHKIVELNNNTLASYPQSREDWKRLLGLCREYQVPVAVDSDAHFCTNVGKTPLALAFLEEVGFPQELVINSSMERLQDALVNWRGKSPDILAELFQPRTDHADHADDPLVLL